MMFHKQRPVGITTGTMSAFWSAYGSDPVAYPKERKKLQLALMIPPFVLLFLVPMGIAAATNRRRELHGSARFANAIEVRNAGLLGDEGIIVGKYRDRFLTLPGKQSVMLSAPTRSGKGVGVVVPNLLAWQDSAVVVDIKSENSQSRQDFERRTARPSTRGHPLPRTLARTAGTRSARSAWPIAMSSVTRWPLRRCCTPRT